ncbi:MAG: OprD family outer membrane porin [Plesiomonas sp.]|uniref:OprD family outer membrane porin n=1 Tax=Plesiomonas sp. TaxID=2486279 RepID=UPI003F30BF73
MEAKQFKVAALSLAVFGALASTSVMAKQDGESQAYGANYEKFIEESTLSGGLFYFQRDRDRRGSGIPGANQDAPYAPNLSHATTQVALNFNSGYAWDFIGLDLGGFYAYDLTQGGTAVDQENEFSFAGNKWGGNFKDGQPHKGASLSTAALKFKAFDGALTAKGGLTQLYVPGLLGVNWSYQPGTYLGGQVEGNYGGLYVTGAYATEYKSPWYRDTQNFSRAKAWMDPFAAANQIDYIYALAARYTFSNGLGLTAGFGQSENYMDSYFAKAAYKFDVLGGLNTSYQFYGSKTDTYVGPDGKDIQTYDGLAWQQALTAALNYNLYDFRAEALFTKAEGAEGNYLPRLTRGYGNSQGANEIWWDSRSDWNANNEKAIFLGVTRKLDDLMGAPGWAVGVSGAYGWGMEKGDGTKASNGADTEKALNFDVMYTLQDGLAKGTLFKLHYTKYENNIPSDAGWTELPNVFASEHDVKFHIIMPLSFF